MGGYSKQVASTGPSTGRCTASGTTPNSGRYSSSGLNDRAVRASRYPAARRSRTNRSTASGLNAEPSNPRSPNLAGLLADRADGVRAGLLLSVTILAVGAIICLAQSARTPTDARSSTALDTHERKHQ
ncbi:MAG: hypothetical protein ACR2HA_14090, partial [Nocardioides sp.]